MTKIGLLGIFLGLLALPFAFVRLRAQILVFFVLLLMHLAASLLYFWYAQSNSADASLYYYAPRHLLRLEASLGTNFTIHFVDALKSLLGGTYLDHFMIFQAFGFWGIAVMLRIFDELALEIGVPFNPIAWGILFLPSLHFWTSAIGKDAPLFLGVSVAVWSSMRLGTRLPFLACALLIMALFRPHVALIAAVSLALAAALGRTTSAQAKAGLLIIGLAGIVITATTVENSLQVDMTSPGSVSSFVERQQAKNVEIGGGTSVHKASLPVRVFSLLFRPLFFDAQGPMGIVASFENMAMIALVVYAVRMRREITRLFREVYFIRFCVFFTFIMFSMLSLLYYNVGLGLRQRVMIFPALFTLFVSLYIAQGVRRISAMARRPQSESATSL